MRQPRFRKYTIEPRAKREGSSTRPGFRRGVVVTLVVILAGILGFSALKFIPVKTTNSGEYAQPQSVSQIEPYSRARWFLHNAQGDVLATSLAWFHNVNQTPARSVAELNAGGFMPFNFVNEAGGQVPVLDIGVEETDDAFLFQLTMLQGTSAGFTSRRSYQNINLFGDSWLGGEDEISIVNPQDDTSIHAQFIEDSSGFGEKYVSFLGQLWEVAAAGYIELYQRPPGSIDDLMTGLGLVPNPDCVWPFDEEVNLDVGVEGGMIDGKILYWRVILEDGGRRGMARYWDQYTTYDDPDTPVNIVTATQASPVVDPALIEGTFRVMFTDETLKVLLESVRPQPVEEDDEPSE